MIYKLKASIGFLIFCFLIFSQNKLYANSFNLEAAKNVIERILPSYSHLFEISEIPKVGEKDVFELEMNNNRIVIRGSSVVSICSGFNWYLKYFCNCHISNSGNQLNIPYPLPRISGIIRIVSPYKYSYFLNHCTYSYSMAFWKWEQWEPFIDWMALNGINLPLSMIGAEVVWYNTLIRFGFTPNEILNYISGPSYFSWWLNGYIEGWGGPVTHGFLSERAGLQERILKRMRELDMYPVAPAFYGIVPNALKKKFPDANIKDQGYWMGDFKRAAFLIPTDPLFSKLSNIYYEEQKKLFGNFDFYSGDPLHVGEAQTEIDYATVGIEIYNSIQKNSPGATFVLQGWQGNPKEQLISGIPYKKVLILDIDCDSRPQWNSRKGWGGYPWIWCSVNNFGGNTGMFSRLDVIANDPLKALNDLNGGYLVGIGALPENIDSNPIYLDLIFEMKWRDKPPNMKNWIKEYARRRYFSDSYATQKAWELLYNSVYSKKINPLNPQQGSSESILCARPSKVIKSTSTWGTTVLYYNPIDLLNALEHMLTVSSQFGYLDTYQHDIVDITRQVLSNLAQRVHHRMMIAFENKNKKEFELWSERFLSIIDDQDLLLGSRKEFMLGPWIESAKAWGKTKEEKELYEVNARSLITLWSYKDSQLREYAHKEWSGLLKSYYKQRWKMFIDNLLNEINGDVSKKIDYYSFEKEWIEKRNLYPVDPFRNPIMEAQRIYEKYSILIYSLYDTKRKNAVPMAYFQLDETLSLIANDTLENAPNNLIKNGDFSVAQLTKNANNWLRKDSSDSIYFEQIPHSKSRLACFKSEGGNFIEQLIEGPPFKSYTLTFDLGYRRDEMVDIPIHFKISLETNTEDQERKQIDIKEIEIKPLGFGIPQLMHSYEVTLKNDSESAKDLFLKFTNTTAVHPTWRATALLDNVCLVGNERQYKGYEGKYVNEPEVNRLSAAPDLGTSVHFSENQTIEIPMDKALNSSNFSISLWVKPHNGNGYRAVISSRHSKQDENSAAYGFALFANPLNHWSFWTGWTQEEIWNWDVLIGPEFEEDKWTHIVIAFDSFDDPTMFGTVSGLKTIYINGEHSQSAVQSLTPNNSGTLNIGSVSDSAFYFEGGIDDIQIYEGILTANQVRWLYTHPGKLIPDTFPPKIIKKISDLTVEATNSKGQLINLPPPLVHDNHDPELNIKNNAPDLFPLGTTEVKWTVTDSAQNKSSVVQKVTVRDTTPPEISYSFNKLSENSEGTFYQIHFMAKDNCDTAPKIKALLKVGNQKAFIINGQIIKVKKDKEKYLVYWHEDRFQGEGKDLFLSIDAVDDENNKNLIEKILKIDG